MARFSPAASTATREIVASKGNSRSILPAFCVVHKRSDFQTVIAETSGDASAGSLALFNVKLSISIVAKMPLGEHANILDNIDIRIVF